MPEKIAILYRLLIFPNIIYPGDKRFIITGCDINMECYFCDTNKESLYKDYWSDKLTLEQKVGVIQAMLNVLELKYGHRFRVIMPFDEMDLEILRSPGEIK
jgi:hypothetical protein